MSTQPDFADSDPPEQDDQPTRPFTAAPPPVTPPPDLEASGNASAALTTAASSDRCSNCGAQLAPDQHYCVVCGERRGRPRFAGAMFSVTPVPEPVPVASGGIQGRATRWPPTATLIAGVATLLVAMGLGILIGHDSSNNTPARAPQQPVNVTVNGGGGGSSAGTSKGASTTASSSPTSSSSNKATKSSTKATPKVSTAQQQKSQQAASKVLGSSSHNTAPATVQQGGACTHGAGCQGGKFTGNFFGG
jgi:hypothetical protein